MSKLKLLQIPLDIIVFILKLNERGKNKKEEKNDKFT